MKKLLFSILTFIGTVGAFAQTYPYYDVSEIRFVDSTSLANCVDTSRYLGDTVVTRGIVIVDGNLSEVVSSSITGRSRPFISIVDTGYGGTIDGFEAAIIMGADPSNNPVSEIENAVAGDIIEITAIVNTFSGLLQLQPISSTAVTLEGSTIAPTFTTISAGSLQDDKRQNILPTGEQWEGAYVELKDVVVTSVSIFSSGNRVEFNVRDADGNVVLVADRFLPMVRNGVTIVNPNSPKGHPNGTGTFIEPRVGQSYKHIRGLIFQDQNGCAGGGQFNGGYEINPIDTTDFLIDSFPAPSIANVVQNPTTVSDTDSVVVTAEVFDIDGQLDTVIFYYSADTMDLRADFTSVAMMNTGGDNYSAVIPAFGRDTIVRYFIEATDDSAKVSSSPYTAPGANLNTYTYAIETEALTIMDIQRVTDLSNDDSPLVGTRVTVTGFVTASLQNDDLNFLYIQDSSSNVFSGIYISGGSANVLNFVRGDEVTVTGEVEENFGFTQIAADTAFKTGEFYVIQPTRINPSNGNYFPSEDSLELYESMLMRYENPSGSVWFIDSLGFGEYTVGSGMNATVDARVLSGSAVEGRSQASLNVSYTNDTASYAANLNPGIIPIQIDSTYRMDYIDGILFYAFGNFKFTPRDNADFSGILVSIESITKSNVETSIYPNPSNGLINIQIDEDYSFNQLNIQLVDLTGRVVLETQTANHFNSMNLFGLDRGVYVLRITNGNENIQTSKIILQ